MKAKKDRLTAGGMAGGLAGLVHDAYGSVMKALGLTDRTFDELSEIVLSSRIYTGALGIIVGILAHLTVSILLGIFFAYIIQISSSRYLILKALAYGLITWFLLSGFGTVFRLPLFKDIPPGPALISLLGALLYGLVLAYTLKFIDKKTGLL